MLSVTAKTVIGCPWVKSRHQRTSAQCPLYSQKQTPRSLKCSHCGHRKRFERTAPRVRFEPEADHRMVQYRRSGFPSFFERVQIPDDLVRLLWGKQD